MICPRCTIGEVAEDTGLCALCGFQPGVGVAVHRPVVDEVLETVQRELEGQFRISVLLRHGTKSVVYVADELPSKRLVALKVIPLQRGMNPDIARFEREAAVSASLNHSHIARVLGFGQTRALLWYSMEYVKGHSLADLKRDSGPLSLETCQKILEQAASALDYMHRRGATHGNLKPSNILVDREEWARVSDACIMSALDGSGRRGRIFSGAPEYMAPEQFRARTVGPSADQYALGVIAYECLSGNLPFVGDAPDEMERLHREEAPPPIGESSEDLPSHVCDAVHRALSKNIAQRFPTVMDFAAMLRRDWAARSVEPLVPEGAPSSPSQVFVIDGAGRNLPVVRLVLAALVVAMIVAGSIWLKPWTAAAGVLGNPAAQPPAITAQPNIGEPISIQPQTPSESTPAVPTEAAERTAPERQRTEAVRQEDSPPRSTTPPVEAGKLFVNSTPWGEVYIDGELMGNTPQVLELPAGAHRLSVVRDGFIPYEDEIQLAPGQQLRLTSIILRVRQP
jgi:serine/threonine-protein kinase